MCCVIKYFSSNEGPRAISTNLDNYQKLHNVEKRSAKHVQGKTMT